MIKLVTVLFTKNLYNHETTYNVALAITGAIRGRSREKNIKNYNQSQK